MVAENAFEEPNLSYVRVNQNSNIVGPVPTGKIPGSCESIKCHITKNMSPTDPQVVNAGLLHKCMVEQAEPTPKPSVPLWTPVHLYASGERRLLLYAREEWKEIKPEESTPKVEAKSVWRSATSQTNSGTKRRLAETTTDIDSGNRAKVTKTDDTETELRSALLKNRSLENANMELKNKVKELEMRIELMSKIMKDPNKLSLLMSHLQGLRRSNETKVVRASAPCVQG